MILSVKTHRKCPNHFKRVQFVLVTSKLQILVQKSLLWTWLKWFEPEQNNLCLSKIILDLYIEGQGISRSNVILKKYPKFLTAHHYFIPISYFLAGYLSWEDNSYLLDAFDTNLIFFSLFFSIPPNELTPTKLAWNGKMTWWNV